MSGSYPFRLRQAAFRLFHMFLDKYPGGVYYACRLIPPQGIGWRLLIMADTTNVNCACTRKKMRDEQERRDLMNRLKRIEGQVRGLQRMLDEDAYCPDILTQASAVNSALNSFCRTLLNSHIRTCVTEDIRAGREDAADELMETLKKLMK